MAVVGSRHQNRIVITGVAAVVRLGYQRAAVLGDWRVEGDWFTARVESVDAFRITQGGLVLEIQNKEPPPTLRPITDVSVTQGQLSARLLPKRLEY